MNGTTQELIKLAEIRLKTADAKGRHHDSPDIPKNLRESDGAAQSCNTCGNYQKNLLGNMCTKYKYPTEPAMVCDSWQGNDFSPDEGPEPAIGDQEPFVSSMAATPGVPAVPKMAGYKQADPLQMQAPGQFASGTIAPPGGAAGQGNAAAGISAPPAQPLMPTNENAQEQQQQQQPGAAQQTTGGQPVQPGAFKPSPVLAMNPTAPQLAGMPPFVQPDPGMQQQMAPKQASFRTLIRLVKSVFRATE